MRTATRSRPSPPVRPTRCAERLISPARRTARSSTSAERPPTSACSTAAFRREATLAVEVAGVRTNFRMPDVISLGIGGGSIVHVDDEVRVGPTSVGHRLTERALVFGGATPTATDVAVAGGIAEIGDPTLVKHLDRGMVREAIEWIHARVGDDDRADQDGARADTRRAGRRRQHPSHRRHPRSQPGRATRLLSRRQRHRRGDRQGRRAGRSGRLAGGDAASGGAGGGACRGHRPLRRVGSGRRIPSRSSTSTRSRSPIFRRTLSGSE